MSDLEGGFSGTVEGDIMQASLKATISRHAYHGNRSGACNVQKRVGLHSHDTSLAALQQDMMDVLLCVTGPIDHSCQLSRSIHRPLILSTAPD